MIEKFSDPQGGFFDTPADGETPAGASQGSSG